MRIDPRRWTRRSLITIVLIGLLLGGAGALAMTGGGVQSNVIAVVNTKDDNTDAKAGMQVAHDVTDVVDNGNAAAASASCTDCRTIAVAVQVVLVEGNPNVVTPTNLAMALNVQCNGCQTMAAAYQYVLSTNGVVHFTTQGQTAMNDIEHRIEGLIDSPLSLFDLEAQIDGQVNQLWDVVDNELVHAGMPFKATSHRKVDVDLSNGEPVVASPSPTDTTPPAASTSPSATDNPATPTPSPTPCPSDTAMPSPSPTDSPTPTPAESPSPCPTDTAATPAPSSSSGVSPSPTDSTLATPSDSPTASPSPTDSSSASPSPSPTDSSSPSP